MMLKRRLSSGSMVCVILDGDLLRGDRAILATARDALSGGADMIQLRHKSSTPGHLLRLASRLKSICGRYRKPFIVNDRVDVALAAGADGVHLGQGDLRLVTARKILGHGKIIGASIASFRQAISAKEAGASYLGAGAIFKTPVKRDRPARGVRLLKRVASLNIPTLAIGGINTKRARMLADNGLHSAAVIRAACLAHDKGAAVKELKRALSS